MKLWGWGGIVPWIGWCWIDVDKDGEPCEEQSQWFADALEVEWLGMGVVLYIGGVYPKEQ